MKFSDIFFYAKQKFSDFRKTTGKPYPDNNIKRSVSMAMHYKKVFTKIEAPLIDEESQEDAQM